MKRFAAALAFLVLASAIPSRGQQPQGPLTPPPDKEAKQIVLNPNPEPPPVPVEEIIKRFTSNEDGFFHAYQRYTYQQTIRLQQIDEDGKVAGELQVKGDVYIKPNGSQYERIIGQPSSTLRGVNFSVEDVEALANLPLFALTSDQLDRYNVTYAGRQQLDELSTYIFRVQPKRMERRHHYFSGVVWVDDHDFAIVKTYGQFVSDTPPEGQLLPFSLFETYRENIESKYWFPTYTRSDDTLHAAKGNDVALRLIIRSTNFKPAPGASNTAATPSSSPQ